MVLGSNTLNFSTLPPSLRVSNPLTVQPTKDPCLYA